MKKILFTIFVFSLVMVGIAFTNNANAFNLDTYVATYEETEVNLLDCVLAENSITIYWETGNYVDETDCIEAPLCYICEEWLPWADVFASEELIENLVFIETASTSYCSFLTLEECRNDTGFVEEKSVLVVAGEEFGGLVVVSTSAGISSALGVANDLFGDLSSFVYLFMGIPFGLGVVRKTISLFRR